MMKRNLVALVLAVVALAAAVYSAPTTAYFKTYVGAKFQVTGPTGKTFKLYITVPVTGTYQFIVAGGYSQGSPVSTTFTVYLDGTQQTGTVWLNAGKTVNVTIVSGASVDTLQLVVAANTSLPFTVASYSFSEPYTTAQLSLNGPSIAYSITVPSGYSVSNPLLVVKVTFNNPVTWLSANSAYYLVTPDGLTVEMDYQSFTATPSLTVKLSPAAPASGDYSLTVAGVPVTGTISGILSNAIGAIAKPGGELNAYWLLGGVKFTSGQFPYSVGDIYVYGYVTPQVVVSQGTNSYGGPGLKVIHGAAATGVKYYALSLSKNTTAEAYLDIGGGWGNVTLYAKVNNTAYQVPASWTQGAVQLVPYWGTSPPLKAPGTITMTVNDTAKALQVQWYNIMSKQSIKYASLYAAPGATAALTESALTPDKMTASTTGYAVLITAKKVAAIQPSDTTGTLYNVLSDKVILLNAGAKVNLTLQTTLTAVVTSGGKPVQGASVNIYNAAGSLIASKSTGSDGKAVFTLEPGAVYTVEVVSGTETQTTTVTLTDDTTVEFTVTQVPQRPLISVDVALLAMLAISFVLLLIVAYYVATSRKAVVIE